MRVWIHVRAAALRFFSRATRSMICAHKCDAERWLYLAGKVHSAGLKTNATMLYGHIESLKIASITYRLANSRTNPAAFNALFRWRLSTRNADVHLPGPSGVDSLKTMAVSRLMLDTSHTSKRIG